VKLKVVCCEVFSRELDLLSKDCQHELEIELLPKGLHDLGQEKMLARMQETVDANSGQGFDAILLVYGLCNNGTSGLTARDTQLVIPRAHDCITLFLGGRDAYTQQFEGHPGTYYRTTGWIEHDNTDGVDDETIQQKLGLFMQYEELVEKYGEDNAKYIQETMGTGVEHYDRLAFIKMGVDGEDPFIDMSREEAKEKGWAFDLLEGSLSILSRLVGGDWDDDFLVVGPGRAIAASHDDGVIQVITPDA
jgi:hypothetical protein